MKKKGVGVRNGDLAATLPTRRNYGIFFHANIDYLEDSSNKKASETLDLETYLKI